MSKRGFLKKHGIVQNAIREDLLYFAIPAIVIFFFGMLVSSTNGKDGLVLILWGLVKQTRQIPVLSFQNIFGLGLLLTGFIIAIVAQITLYRSYSSTLIIRENHQLITHGIYSLIRHPIYLGVILAAIGIPVCSASLLGFLIMSVLIPVFLIRVKFEERLLIEAFGDDYRAYQVRTRKLIPFIY